MFENALRFWFDRGVDGFRLDVAHGLVKHPDLANWPPPASGVLLYNDHMWNQPEVHDIYRSWRALADSYPGTAPKVLIGEVWVPDDAELARYVRSDELHQVFYFQLLGQRWDAGNFRSAISAGLQTCAGQPTWTMANHDVHRTVTRLGTATHGEVDTGSDLLAAARLRGEVDVTLGERRARASLLLILALPGSVYLYQGEELGLPEVLNFPEGTRQDPMWTRSNGKEPGRDGCRVPLPWQPIGTSYGFSPPDAALPPWLPQPDWFSSYAVSEQLQQRNSFLSLNQEALILRRAIWHTTSPLTWLETGTPDVIAFSRGAAICAVNFGLNAYRLPAQWGSVVLLSREGDQEYLQANSGAWIVMSGRQCEVPP